MFEVLCTIGENIGPNEVIKMVFKEIDSNTKISTISNVLLWLRVMIIDFGSWNIAVDSLLYPFLKGPFVCLWRSLGS